MAGAGDGDVAEPHLLLGAEVLPRLHVVLARLLDAGLVADHPVGQHEAGQVAPVGDAQVDRHRAGIASESAVSVLDGN